MYNMGLHDPFKHLKHKLWPKERLGIKLAFGCGPHGEAQSIL